MSIAVIFLFLVLVEIGMQSPLVTSLTGPRKLAAFSRRRHMERDEQKRVTLPGIRKLNR